MKISFKAETKRDVYLHLGIVLALFVLLVLSFFYLWLPYTTNHGQTVAVPDLRNMSLEQVEEFLSERDLEFIVDDSLFDPKAKPLTVRSQDPAPGAKVKQGRKIFLTLYAMKPPMVKMPKLTNRSYLNAQGELESYGLLLGKTEYVPDLQVNMVIKQMWNGKEIAEGTLIPKGAQIDLVVGDGQGQQELEMPNLIGTPLEEARTILGGSDLQIGTTIYQPQPDSAQNVVIKQKPAPGTKVRVGDLVDLWIRGNDPAAGSGVAD